MARLEGKVAVNTGGGSGGGGAEGARFFGGGARGPGGRPHDAVGPAAAGARGDNGALGGPVLPVCGAPSGGGARVTASAPARFPPSGRRPLWLPLLRRARGRPPMKRERDSSAASRLGG